MFILFLFYFKAKYNIVLIIFKKITVKKNAMAIICIQPQEYEFQLNNK